MPLPTRGPGKDGKDSYIHKLTVTRVYQYPPLPPSPTRGPGKDGKDSYIRILTITRVHQRSAPQYPPLPGVQGKMVKTLWG